MPKAAEGLSLVRPGRRPLGRTCGLQPVPGEPCVARASDTALQSSWSEVPRYRVKDQPWCLSQLHFVTVFAGNYWQGDKQGRATGMARPAHGSAPWSHSICLSHPCLYLSTHACCRTDCLDPSLCLSLLLPLSIPCLAQFPKFLSTASHKKSDPLLCRNIFIR